MTTRAVFFVKGNHPVHDCYRGADYTEPTAAGWYWWQPSGVPRGPFVAEADAMGDARRILDGLGKP